MRPLVNTTGFWEKNQGVVTAEGHWIPLYSSGRDGIDQCDWYRNKIDALKADSAEAIAFYTSGRLKGTPAITVNNYGDGKAILYGFNGCDVYFYEAFAREIQKMFALSPIINADDGILVSSRKTADGEYVFAVNMKDSPNTVHLESDAVDMISDEKISGGFTLKPYQTIIFRK